jgi:hypothetical protein
MKDLTPDFAKLELQLEGIVGAFAEGTVRGGEQSRDLIANFVQQLGEKLPSDIVVHGDGLILLAEQIRRLGIELFDPCGVITLAAPKSDLKETYND